RNAMLGIHRDSKRNLKSINVGATNKGAVANDRRNRSVDVTLDSLILKMKVRERYRHQKSPSLYVCSSSFPRKFAHRISGIGSWYHDVLCHHGASADNDIVADSNRQNGGI